MKKYKIKNCKGCPYFMAIDYVPFKSCKKLKQIIWDFKALNDWSYDKEIYHSCPLPNYNV